MTEAVPERPGDEIPVPPEREGDAEAPRDAGPAPLGVVLAPTGSAEVDAALERLADADDLPTGSHVEVYEDVHTRLRDALTALDAAPGPPGPRESAATYDDRS
ncbi:hypothetical protein K7472_07295 [Streptomyces sp. PTM05]|uniref:Uncharacterized protein n=1 Tax=Streptantibioticus parmotrematis TaxID=2873249 RepID=A0ABS7QNB5_9ACTN|nr:hypothetical protein [Streptantibioticus parmotrematis]MBY8884650.1 hypothetical protein [Streptantibioticus parmotrematis]